MVDQRQISKDIFQLIIPVILENILQMTAGLITTAMIGRLLPIDISAQGIGMRIYQMGWVFFKGISMGATVVVAISYGERQYGRCRRLVEQSFLTLVPLALMLSVVVYFLRAPVAGFLTDEVELLQMSMEYLKIIVWTFPFAAICCLVTAAFNAHGNTKTPMFIAGVLNIVNVVLGYMFIFGGFGCPKLGLIGAGIATIISQMVGATLGLFLLFHPRNGFLSGVESEGKFFSFDWPGIREIYATGIPASVEYLLWQFAALVISKIILSYGSVYFAAYQIGLQAEGIAEMPAMGFVTAATTLSATAIGMRNDELYRAYHHQLIKIATLFSTCTALLLFTCAKPFMAFLTSSTEVQAIGFWYVFLMGIPQIPQNLSRVYNGILRSSGYKKAPMVISLVGLWGIRVPLCVLIGWVLKIDIFWIWCTIALDQTARFVISAALFKMKGVINTVTDMNEAEAKLPQPQA